MRNRLLRTVVRAALLLLFMSTTTPTSLSRKPPQTKADARNAAAIRAVLEAQRDAWNRGDIEGYMDGYERSDETVFVSGDNVTHGWQTVLERYKKGYDTREKMGTLTFSDLEITPLGKNAAIVLGRWSLKRTSDQPHGRFTLIFKHTKQGWKIIHDHTSSST
jgi:ketosteroid isomerase-like protein